MTAFRVLEPDHRVNDWDALKLAHVLSVLPKSDT